MWQEENTVISYFVDFVGGVKYLELIKSNDLKLYYDELQE